MRLSKFSRLALPVFCGAALFALLHASPSHAQHRWERNYGGAGGESGNSVQQTTDGGYIVAGYLHDLMNKDFPYLVKTNASGDILWARTYFGEYDGLMGSSVHQTQDGGYIVAGGKPPPTDWAWLLKTNASGDSLWSRNYRYGTSSGAQSVQQTLEGGYIFAGRYGYNMFARVYLVKTNASGDTLWSRTYGAPYMSWGSSVQQTRDTGYVLAGLTESSGNGRQAYLVKTNAYGDTFWTRTYGGAGEDQGNSVRQTADGGYVIAGHSYSFRDTINGDVYLIRTNASGDTLWTRTYGGRGYDAGYSVQQTQDGGYIIAGYTCSYRDTIYGDAWLIKTNANGDTLWTRTYGGTSGDAGYSVQKTSDAGYIVAGWTNSFGNGGQVYLIKTNANGSSAVEEARNAERGMRSAELRITPNPYVSFARVPGHEGERFSLYDVSGRKVGTYRGDKVGEGLAAGVYFVRGKNSTSTPLRIVKVR